MRPPLEFVVKSSVKIHLKTSVKQIHYRTRLSVVNKRGSMEEDNKNLKKRCGWCGDEPIYQDYHDYIWGRPRWDSQDLFAKLCLDGQQAGLSWITILRKEKTYYAAYDNFEPEKIVHYDQVKIDSLLQDTGVVRNKLKVNSIIKNTCMEVYT